MLVYVLAPAAAIAPSMQKLPGWVDCDAFVLINILNPKLSIFFLAFLPQFVSSNDPQTLSRMLGLSAVFMLLTFIVFVCYGLCAAALRSHVISRPRVLTWLRRLFASAFLALGAKLALADR
jgi:threonine/homoserine/homoserine lactone efflux protein